MLVSRAIFHLRNIAALVSLSLILPAWVRADIAAGTRYPSDEEQYALQLINKARSSANGLAILQELVSNNLATITPSTTRNSMDGTPWSQNFWTSSISGVAFNMNANQVHPGDLKRQFMDLVIPNYPLAWHPNLGNVASGYNSIVIASGGVANGPGAVFPHSLAPYQDDSTFAAYAKRYTDGGYGPLADINAIGENIAPNNFSSTLSRFAEFMVDWGHTAGTPNDGIQDQDPATGSHRLSIMATSFQEIGISALPGWNAGNVCEDQEFGRRFSRHVVLTGSVYRDLDSNGFYTPGEGASGVRITATPSGGGAAISATSFRSGGYVLELNTAGTYAVSVSGWFGTISKGNFAVGNQNIALDVVLPPGTTAGIIGPDFNGDGNDDLVWQNTTTGQRTIWFMNGTTFAGSASLGTIATAWQIAAIGDFNGDGKPDILWQNTTTGARTIWFMNGATRTGYGSLGSVATEWQIAAIGDFNGDGKTDILWQNTVTGARTIWLMNGTRITGYRSLGTVSTDWQIAAVADLNGDGKPDILWQNTVTGARTIWFMNGTTITGYGSLGVVSTDWQIAGTGDFNGDGNPDILWQNAVTGQRFVWFMNGAAHTGGANLGTIPIDWKIRD